VRTRTRFHGDDAAGGKLRASGNEFVARQGPGREHLTTTIDSVNLDHALAQIDADANGLAAGGNGRLDSCNHPR